MIWWAKIFANPLKNRVEQIVQLSNVGTASYRKEELHRNKDIVLFAIY